MTELMALMLVIVVVLVLALVAIARVGAEYEERTSVESERHFRWRRDEQGNWVAEEWPGPQVVDRADKPGADG